MRTFVKRLPFAAAFLFACMLDTVLVGPASAHVKWFCAYDVAGQPDGLGNVLCLDFEMLTGLSLMALMTGALLEGTPVGFCDAARDSIALLAWYARILKRSSVPAVHSFSSRSGAPVASF